MSNVIKPNINFVNGALKAIELFKVVFDVNKNVVITTNNKIHINNTELLLQERNFNDKEFTFGFNFVLKTVYEYREKLCINPIFYLLLLEQFLKIYLKKSKKELNEYCGNVVLLQKFLFNYKENSSLKNAKPTLEELYGLEKEFLKNDFLMKVAKESYDLKSIEILEEKFNLIEEDRYYTLKCRKYGNGNIFYDKEVYIWFSKITKKEFDDFFDFVLLNKKNVVVFFNEVDNRVKERLENISKYTSNILFIHYPGLKFFDVMKDINILSGKTNVDTFYDSSFGSIYNYIPGKLKELRFEDGKLKIKSYKNFKDYEKYTKYLQNYNHLDRFLMMKQNGIIIKCKEDILEECRSIVSISRSIYNKGVFFDEEYSLKLFIYYLKNSFKDKGEFINFLLLTLKEYYLLTEKNKVSKINEVNNLSVVNKKFTAFELYELSFTFLLSNIKVLMEIKE